MIRGKYNLCVIQQVSVLEGLHDRANTVIDEGDLAVVVGLEQLVLGRAHLVQFVRRMFEQQLHMGRQGTRVLATG